MLSAQRAIRHPESIPKLQGEETICFTLQLPQINADDSNNEGGLEVEVIPLDTQASKITPTNPLDQDDKTVSQLLYELLQRGDRDLNYAGIIDTANNGVIE